jgi:hypothetical protein
MLPQRRPGIWVLLFERGRGGRPASRPPLLIRSQLAAVVERLALPTRRHSCTAGVVRCPSRRWRCPRTPRVSPELPVEPSRAISMCYACVFFSLSQSAPARGRSLRRRRSRASSIESPRSRFAKELKKTPSGAFCSIV